MFSILENWWRRKIPRAEIQPAGWNGRWQDRCNTAFSNMSTSIMTASEPPMSRVIATRVFRGATNGDVLHRRHALDSVEAGSD